MKILTLLLITIREFLLNRYQIVINKSFNYSKEQSDMLYWQFVNETTNEI